MRSFKPLAKWFERIEEDGERNVKDQRRLGVEKRGEGEGRSQDIWDGMGGTVWTNE